MSKCSDGDTGYIYALLDPSTDEVRYIGQTINSLETRLYQHLHTYNNDTYKDRWLNQLLSSGQKPKIVPVCITSRENLDDMEFVIICAARQKEWRLTNTADGGRQLYGERNPRSVLTEEDVVEAREKYATGSWAGAALATKYGVKKSTMYSVLLGKNWGFAGGPIAEPTSNRGENHRNAVLDEETVLDMRKRYSEGLVTQRELAEEIDASRYAIACALRGETWSHVGGPLTKREYVLSRDEKEAIRYKFADGVSKDELCIQYNIDRQYLTNVLKGKIGVRAGGPLIDAMTMSGEDHPTSKLTEDDVLEIRKEYRKNNTSYRELAKRYSVIHATIGTIVRGETWPNAPGPIKGVDY